MLFAFAGSAFAATKPNVIFFATDDFSDWVGPLNSPIKAKRPNLDRLAARGVTFQNAHASGTFCAPARTAVFTGRHLSTTGTSTTQVFFRDHPELRPLQVALPPGGDQTFGTGTRFHHPAGYVDLRGWTELPKRTAAQREAGWPVDRWRQGAPLPTPMPSNTFTREMRAATDRTFMAYAPLPNDLEKDMAATPPTDWVVSVIQRAHAQPFFVWLGLSAPHFPNYAPQKYFDLHPLDEIKLPPIKDDDTDDLPPALKKFYDHRKTTIHDKLNGMGLMKEGLRAYLASIAEVDAMLGRVLDALDASAARDNTVVIFWSDQGYHHGEKGQWGKPTLWKRTANIPCIWAGPGLARGASVGATVSAIDLFPTLVELGGLAPDASLAGVSLASTLREPALAKDRHLLLCEIRQGGYAMTNSRWRSLHYAEGGEELYDVVKDPNEGDNLASQESYRDVKAELRQSAPKHFAAPGPESNALDLVTDGESFRREAENRRHEEKNQSRQVMVYSDSSKNTFCGRSSGDRLWFTLELAGTASALIADPTSSSSLSKPRAASLVPHRRRRWILTAPAGLARAARVADGTERR
jgi:arylsulfatase A-like enzyme